MNKTKRNLAKALGVVGASATVWKKPVVDAVYLPAHAATSCSVESGCYGPSPGGTVYYFDWPGGGGGQDDVVFHVDSCGGDSPGAAPVALASSQSEAQLLLEQVDADCVDCTAELLLSMDGPCDFYWYGEDD